MDMFHVSLKVDLIEVLCGVLSFEHMDKTHALECGMGMWYRVLNG